MGGSTSSSSPLESAAGVAGPHVTEAFKLLSDETRLAILLTLWEAYEPGAPGPQGLAFSELRERVGAEDSGNFAYHLDKLGEHFVEQAEEGYRLSNAGLKIVRSVIAGTGIEERGLSPTEVPRDCPACGASTTLSYEDQRLYQRCNECEGHVGPDSSLRAPPGTLFVHEGFDPAGLVGRTPGEVFVAGTIDYHRTVTLVVRGICPECSGPVEETLRICEDHDPSEGTRCSTCGTLDEVRACYVCSVCKFNVSYPAWAAAFDHPAVVSFYYDHGFEMTYGLEEPEAAGHLWDRLLREQELVSKTPVRIRVTIRDEGETLELTLDGDLDVVDVQRPFEAAEARVEA